jgi:CopG family transcriptional regulator/antitoxin EndoAI
MIRNMAPKATARLHERINITLPRATLGLLDRLARKGDRSRFIDEAIRQFARRRSRERLRELLEEDGRVNRDRDLAALEAWAAADVEAWRGRRKR